MNSIKDSFKAKASTKTAHKAVETTTKPGIAKKDLWSTTAYYYNYLSLIKVINISQSIGHNKNIDSPTYYKIKL